MPLRWLPQLPRAAHVCDELNDGDHVWIDVGDGTPISRVMSRSFPDRMLFEPAPDQDFQEKLGKIEDIAVGHTEKMNSCIWGPKGTKTKQLRLQLVARRRRLGGRLGALLLELLW